MWDVFLSNKLLWNCSCLLFCISSITWGVRWYSISQLSLYLSLEIIKTTITFRDILNIPRKRRKKSLYFMTISHSVWEGKIIYCWFLRKRSSNYIRTVKDQFFPSVFERQQLFFIAVVE